MGTQQVLNKCTPKVNPQRPPCLTSSLLPPCSLLQPCQAEGLFREHIRHGLPQALCTCSPSVEHSIQACSLAHSRHSVNSGLNG